MSGAVILLILESVCVYLLVLSAHSLRTRVGLGPFYALLGGITAIMSWLTDAGVQVQAAGVTFVVGSTVFYTALLLGVFVVYVFDGPRSTRMAILCIAGVSILMPVVAAVLHVQMGMSGQALLGYVPMPSLRVNAASVLATVADFVFLAMAWEFLGKPQLQMKIWLRAFLTLLGIMGLDVVLFATGAFAGTPAYLSIVGGTLLSRLIISVFAAPFLFVYLNWQNRTKGAVIENRPVLAILREVAQVRTELDGAQKEIAYRRQIERETRERQRYLEGVLKAAPDAIITVDFCNRVVEWSRGAEELFGYSLGEAMGRDLDDLVAGPDVRQEAAGLTQVAASGQELLPIETVRHRKDGTPVDVIVAASSIVVDGEFTGLVGVYTDITERKQAEERLQRYAVELQRANEEVKQFAYIVSHDLRAPLVNLKGFSAELRSALREAQPAIDAALPHLDAEQRRSLTLALEEDVPEALHFIESSVTRMDDFIHALLNLSRLGRRELCPEVLDMDDLVRQTLETVAHQLDEHQATVSVEPLPKVVADRTSMEQILGNLLGNAIKYLVPGRPGELEISAECCPNETLFRIRDNGRGIAAEDMPKVFAPFRRIGRQDTPGEGMGLPYVQALVRRHGGRIWCESEEGAGTTFCFSFPNHIEGGKE